MLLDPAWSRGWGQGPHLEPRGARGRGGGGLGSMYPATPRCVCCVCLPIRRLLGWHRCRSPLRVPSCRLGAGCVVLQVVRQRHPLAPTLGSGIWGGLCLRTCRVLCLVGQQGWVCTAVVTLSRLLDGMGRA